MSVEPMRVRFERDSTPGPKQDHKLTGRIVEVRKLLRSSLSIDQIADELGVARCTLTAFIKRRRLCNISERNHFISQQRSLARAEAIEASQ